MRKIKAYAGFAIVGLSFVLLTRASGADRVTPAPDSADSDGSTAESYGWEPYGFLVGGAPGSEAVSFLEKGVMTPSGNPLLESPPKTFKWTRVEGATRYRLTLSLQHKKTGVYAIVSRSWISQPAAGGPKWKPPVHALITGGQYCWTIREYAGTTPGATAIAYFRIKTEKNAYLVIDLSAGPSVDSYPVAYLNAVPPGGWTDVHKTSKLVLRKIPAGNFIMGSPAYEVGRRPDSSETQHQVTLTKGYYIGVFEVTQRQWELVMGSRPSFFDHVVHYATRPVEQVSYFQIRDNAINNADDPNAQWPSNSVVNATSFMNKLRVKTGLSKIDLPTEAQWEYACRAGTATALNSGKNLSEGTSTEMDVLGRYLLTAGDTDDHNAEANSGTAKVGSYLPNAWGLYDMHGNVNEWCLDWLGAYPGAVSDPKGAASGPDRVWRGGGITSMAAASRSAWRDNSRMGHYGLETARVNYIGLRVAMTLP